MDNQWVTRVINIRALLEKSKTVAVHAYSQSPVTKRLVYNISHAALQLITAEVSSLGKSRFGGRCLCILRKTYGLPCACEILNCHKNCSHISLDSIHEHWKHLSMDPEHEKVAAVFDWEDLFEKIRMKYEACTELQKYFMLEMLIEIADPSKTTMQEPIGKFATRGRPTNAQTKAQKKKDESTKRDLSEWERQCSRTTSTSASKKVPFKAKKKALVKSHMTNEVKIIDLPDLNVLPNLNDMNEEDVFPSKVVLKRKKVQCPIKAPKQRRKYTKTNKINSQAMSYDDEYLQKLIQGITLENVAPDGHCGFRACAEMLGLSADDGWKTVKIEMERELTVNSEMYIPIIGGVEEYRKILTTLIPPPLADFKVVTILNLDNEHFVKAILKPGAPLPPVLNGWNSICTEEALLWTPRMEMLHRGWENIDQKLLGQGLHVIEEIDLDEP
ncbi:hypothetical protein MKW98_020948 [Papaver atlanticum]|uniref:OTU domain-containing protein n=1 Tax=Papaver atlanticum TaxID=357466 RepID=A0AAD4TE38_9MAGN|nr:hypothetical protein MKW98_020948 [Papaver atlanticum]